MGFGLSTLWQMHIRGTSLQYNPTLGNELYQEVSSMLSWNSTDEEIHAAIRKVVEVRIRTEKFQNQMKDFLDE